MESVKTQGTEIPKSRSEFNKSISRLKKNKLAVFGYFFAMTYILVSLLAPILPFYPIERQVIDHQNLPPSFATAGEEMIKHKRDYYEKYREAVSRRVATKADTAELQKMAADLASAEANLQKEAHNQFHYLAGTDNLGRDLLARTISGGSISISIGLTGSLLALIIGVLVGAIAGYKGGWLDSFLMRFVDIMYGLPYLLMVIILMAALGRNFSNLILAVALISWLDVARVVRGQVLSLKNSEFIEAAKSMGATTWYIIFRHLIPNLTGLLIVYGTLLLPRFILSESFLSFLGLGVSAPMTSWGTLISDGVKTMEQYPWQLLIPAAAMTLFMFAVNFLGDGLRDAFDPKSKKES